VARPFIGAVDACAVDGLVVKVSVEGVGAGDPRTDEEVEQGAGSDVGVWVLMVGRGEGEAMHLRNDRRDSGGGKASF
jgi:hypothetical protein